MDSLMPQPCGPPLTTIYADITTAVTALQSHAKAHGYALFKRDSQPPKRESTNIIYACDREGNNYELTLAFFVTRNTPRAPIVISMAHRG
jgi:hypothetical protein